MENGDGGGDGDYLHFYVAITLPQMPLSEIDGVVNLFSVWRAKERHLILVRVGGTARCAGAVLNRDRNLFRVLIGNNYD